MHFGYLQAVGAGGQAKLLKTFSVQDIIYYTVFVIGAIMVGPGKNFGKRQKILFSIWFLQITEPFC